jgi:hypothetical protein
MTARSVLIALAAVALLALTASAFPGDLNGMPNGPSYGITLGHPGGNIFKTTGIAQGYYGAGQTWSQSFCQADSDGDGQSNGLEMGDPCCVWTADATPMFTTGLSDPNSAASTTTNAMPNCAALAAEFQAAAKRTSAVRPMRSLLAQQVHATTTAVPCNLCIAIYQAIPAANATEICMVEMKCQPAAEPPAAPKPTCDKCIADLSFFGELPFLWPAADIRKFCITAAQCQPTDAPKAISAVRKSSFAAAPKQAMALAANVPCDKCIAELTAQKVTADDAAEICQLLKCQAAAAPVAMWSTFSNFATSAAGVPFSDCSAAGHTLQVASVALNPNPPQKGQSVAISISGNLAAAVDSATAQLTVSLGAFTVLTQSFQLPAAAVGPVTQTVNLVVPGFAPSGTYTAQGVIMSGGQQLACITADFNL